MMNVHRWIRSHADITEPELSALLRNSVLQQPYLRRSCWVGELELSLAAYAGPLARRAARAREVLEDLLISLVQEGLVRGAAKPTPHHDRAS
jgi:hypothetical protein